MRRLFLANLRVVEQFVEGGIDDMAAKPTSLADIAKSQKRWKELCDERPSMKRMAAECDEQRKLLLSMSGGSVDLSDIVVRVGKLPALWDAFDSALDAFTGVVEEQRTALKGEARVSTIRPLAPPPPATLVPFSFACSSPCLAPTNSTTTSTTAGLRVRQATSRRR